MPDREKVISKLEKEVQRTYSIKTTVFRNGEKVSEEINTHREPCVRISIEMVDKILTMLKEQEARIIGWEELEDWENAVWFEDNDEHECYIALIANVGTYDAKFTNVEPGYIHSLVFMRDFYMKEWRCWSARPTIKQIQAVKWE